jgi:hypothetical protein
MAPSPSCPKRRRKHRRLNEAPHHLRDIVLHRNGVLNNHHNNNTYHNSPVWHIILLGSFRT